MYTGLLHLHNVSRWLVLVAAIYAIVVSLRGLTGNKTWTKVDQRAGLIYSSLLGVQLIIGLILYVISPVVQSGLRDMASTMQNSQIRFFVVEHITLMILAVIVGQLGYSLSKRAATDKAKFTRSSIGYILATVLVLFGIPWWRPFFPGM
ncbi:MAG: hypothetical protein ACRCYY_17930 [Trueperaceae bacterium]